MRTLVANAPWTFAFASRKYAETASTTLCGTWVPPGPSRKTTGRPSCSAASAGNWGRRTAGSKVGIGHLGIVDSGAHCRACRAPASHPVAEAARRRTGNWRRGRPAGRAAGRRRGRAGAQWRDRACGPSHRRAGAAGLRGRMPGTHGSLRPSTRQDEHRSRDPPRPPPASDPACSSRDAWTLVPEALHYRRERFRPRTRRFPSRRRRRRPRRRRLHGPRLHGPRRRGRGRRLRAGGSDDRVRAEGPRADPRIPFRWPDRPAHGPPGSRPPDLLIRWPIAPAPVSPQGGTAARRPGVAACGRVRLAPFAGGTTGRRKMGGRIKHARQPSRQGWCD